MKRSCLVVLAVGCLTWGAASVAQAQATFGVGAGLTMPMGDYGDAASVGFHGMGNVLFGLGTGPLAVRVDVAYHRTGLEQGVDGHTALAGGMASVVYKIPATGQIKPYVLAGLGYYNVKLDVTGIGSTDESNLAFGGGAGLTFGMSGASLFVEARYLTVQEGDTFAATNFLPLTVGIRFGGK